MPRILTGCEYLRLITTSSVTGICPRTSTSKCLSVFLGYWAAWLCDWWPIMPGSIVYPPSRIQYPNTQWHPKYLTKTGELISTDVKDQNSYKFKYFLFLFLPQTTQYDASPRRRLRKAFSVGIMFSSASLKALACYDVFQNSCELMNQRLVIRKGN
jgi:hypothetical protein